MANKDITLKADLTCLGGPDFGGFPGYCGGWNTSVTLNYQAGSGSQLERWVGTTNICGSTYTLTYGAPNQLAALQLIVSGGCLGAGLTLAPASCNSAAAGSYCGKFSAFLQGSCCVPTSYVFYENILVYNASGPCPTPPPCTFCPDQSDQPIRYATGELALVASDLSGNGFGISWGHTRSFSSMLSSPLDLGNGWNWQIREWKYLILSGNGIGSPPSSLVVLMGSPGQVAWFDLT